ncbi:FAD-dependent oxidoreductase [Noviherbaspirillum saxi]|uniref:FAD-dependent oxidoreductase n=1 Tax=Noviherbaspirillum saxi TaxID=2320863 RepID=A0A3A3FQK1_9BURK|nr:FAD-dependent oxidoreductase [Noviherbaspirillum saxi]RJF95989.1 FAD-dependent oxidoreductase [Noviherbaspirillum saxi]
MEKDYQHLRFDYLKSPDEVVVTPVRRPVVVVGAGPVGLSMAIDLAQQGVPVVVLDDDCSLSTGSRAICFAKRTLEIFDRLGCGDRIAEKGVSWNVGKVFYRDEMVYAFDLLPEAGHRRPAFVNLQQYYVEGYLLDRASSLPNLDIRWKNKVVGVTQPGQHVELHIETPAGSYVLHSDYVVAADGSRSAMRKLCGLESKGQTFHDRFLIADVRMKADFPPERWFWFDPPFHRNQSVLLHRQPDNVWRIDFQLGWDADPVAEKEPEKVLARVRALLGQDAEFELEWVSVYTFSCLRMDSFRKGRVFFAGDAAHGVSPFGARGANSGVQDADNLAWKLRLVIEAKAPETLLDSYCQEREYAADENILNSTRSTDFITPKTPVSRTFRDTVLRLSRHYEFARRLVNSGRLSRPSVLGHSALNTPDRDVFRGAMVPGAPADDAPVTVGGNRQWFSARLGNEFAGVYFCDGSDAALGALTELTALASASIPVRCLIVLPADAAGLSFRGIESVVDIEGMLANRFDATPGTFYLLRPDQHICARWRRFDTSLVADAMVRATGMFSDQACNTGQPCLA